jgi:bifunctional DNA-binding transcriptional regulator/antitoxin component of YhaV-PrlF toxin-antitoxin module
VRFTARLGERGVVVPGDPKAEFGGARAPVGGTVNGTPFRGRLMVYGGVTYLGFRKEIRDAAGIVQGDGVEVDIERDDAPRVVEVPEALSSALAADPEAMSAFEALAFTHRREYAQWIAQAKKEETRSRRVIRAIEMLRAGAKHP